MNEVLATNTQVFKLPLAIPLIPVIVLGIFCVNIVFLWVRKAPSYARISLFVVSIASFMLTFTVIDWWFFAPVCIGFGIGTLLVYQNKRRWPGYLLIFCAALTAGIFVPGLFQESIVISPGEIRSTSGFWFHPTYREITYRDVDHVRMYRYYDSEGYSTGTNVKVWYSDGQEDGFDADLVWRRNTDKIVALLQLYGVKVQVLK